ncbi:hypothetical protein WJX72_008946 [[Myrmecia] bisecta]|uniref:Nudix hydrolase domain-containing protein n=1 Tax=[Myrmecia] bisecta TaxID=41462 RepID=A0AAW1QFU7_9CHLO
MASLAQAHGRAKVKGKPSPWRPPVRRRASSYVVQAKYAVGYVADCLKHPERETWRAAGVLPYMFGEDDELRVLLIKQEGGLPSSFRQLRRHGAWNLLGGKRDAKDESAEATALREMTEETGGLLNPDDVPDGFQTVVWHPLGRYAAFPYHVKGKADLPELYASWRKDGGACAGGRNTIEMRWIPLADLNEPNRRKMHGASMRNNGVNAQRRQIEVATQSSTSLGACSSSEDTADGRTAASLHVGQEVERPDTHTSAQPELESPHMPDKAGREPGNKVQAADVDATGTSLVLEPDDRAEVAQDEPAGASAVAEGAVLGAAAAKPTPEVLSGEVAAALGVGAEAASMLAEDLFGLPSSRLNLPETLSEASGGAWTCWPKPTQARAGPAVPDLTAVEYLREGRAAYRQMKCALLEEYGLDSEAYRTDTGSQW